MTLPAGIKATYVENDGLSETFVDSFQRLSVNTGIVHLDMCATRIDEPQPPNPPKARQFPVVRAVMPLNSAIDLFNMLSNLFGALESQGLVKRESTGQLTPIPPGTTKH